MFLKTPTILILTVLWESVATTTAVFASRSGSRSNTSYTPLPHALDLAEYLNPTGSVMNMKLNDMNVIVAYLINSVDKYKDGFHLGAIWSSRKYMRLTNAKEPTIQDIMAFSKQTFELRKIKIDDFHKLQNYIRTNNVNLEQAYENISKLELAF